ncbi:MAG: hypothetical protein H6622_00555 [Halobacteriovoraceae bacterium]|nr:hypothetical protein [Halobacteriovoraceae bacterium]
MKCKIKLTLNIMIVMFFSGPGLTTDLKKCELAMLNRDNSGIIVNNERITLNNNLLSVEMNSQTHQFELSEKATRKALKLFKNNRQIDPKLVPKVLTEIQNFRFQNHRFIEVIQNIEKKLKDIGSEEELVMDLEDLRHSYTELQVLLNEFKTYFAIFGGSRRLRERFRQHILDKSSHYSDIIKTSYQDFTPGEGKIVLEQDNFDITQLSRFYVQYPPLDLNIIHTDHLNRQTSLAGMLILLVDGEMNTLETEINYIVKLVKERGIELVIIGDPVEDPRYFDEITEYVRERLGDKIYNNFVTPWKLFQADVPGSRNKGYEKVFDSLYNIQYEFELKIERLKKMYSYLGGQSAKYFIKSAKRDFALQYVAQYINEVMIEFYSKFNPFSDVELKKDSNISQAQLEDLKDLQNRLSKSSKISDQDIKDYFKKNDEILKQIMSFKNFSAQLDLEYEKYSKKFKAYIKKYIFSKELDDQSFYIEHVLDSISLKEEIINQWEKSRDDDNFFNDNKIKKMILDALKQLTDPEKQVPLDKVEMTLENLLKLIDLSSLDPVRSTKIKGLIRNLFRGWRLKTTTKNTKRSNNQLAKHFKGQLMPLANSHSSSEIEAKLDERKSLPDAEQMKIVKDMQEQLVKLSKSKKVHKQIVNGNLNKQYRKNLEFERKMEKENKNHE